MSITAPSVLAPLGAIDQLSYAVHDLTAALPRFEPLFGAFRVARLHLDDFVYRGEPAEAVIDVGFGRSGTLEIELVSPVSGKFAQQEFLSTHGEGLHHVRYSVDDLDAQETRLATHGFATVMKGQSPRVRFAYLEAPLIMGGSLVELVEWRTA